MIFQHPKIIFNINKPTYTEGIQLPKAKRFLFGEPLWSAVFENYFNINEEGKNMRTHCPECKGPLHEGQHRFPDGIFRVQYCKHCGFREESSGPKGK